MPLSVETGKVKTKKYGININYYRNWNRFQEANIKKKYQSIVYSKLKDHRFKKYKKIALKFILWKSSKRKTDRCNVLSLHEKYFCDGLTQLQFIEDDNDQFIASSFYVTGGIDRDNPRVDIEVTVLQ